MLDIGAPEPYLKMGSFTKCSRDNVNRVVIKSLDTSLEKRICHLQIAALGPLIRSSGIPNRDIYVTFGKATSLTVPAPDLVADDWTVEVSNQAFFDNQ